MISEWSYLLTNNMRYWKPHFPLFAQKIQARLRLARPEYDQPDEPFKIFCFIDCNQNQTCRPGGGPATNDSIRRSGIKSARNNHLIQRSF